MNKINVNVKSEIGVACDVMVAASGCGMLSVVRIKATLMRICMDRIHQRFVFKMSTKGLHSGLIAHGR